MIGLGKYCMWGYASVKCNLYDTGAVVESGCLVCLPSMIERLKGGCAGVCYDRVRRARK